MARHSKTRSRMPRRKWAAGRGALMLIGLMFASSAGLRIATGAGPAIAKEVSALTGANTEQSAPQVCTSPNEIDAILQALRLKEDQLSQRESDLLALEQSLRLAEIKVRENLAALEAAEQSLSQTIAKSELASETDLKRLTAVYEGMKPKDAAGLFEEMDPEFAAGFIGRMRPDAAAAIMTGLSAPTAYSISVILAGRNANAPTE